MKIYRLTRDLHLYLGLFVSPFVLAFAVSVFFLVHAWLPQASSNSMRTVLALPLPPKVEKLAGKERIDALRPALERAGVHGEVGWIQHRVKENKLIVPVSVPGRVTTVTIDLARGEASIQEQGTGLGSGLVLLHKSPGPHLADIRMNWWPMRVWFWLADATVYLLLFITVSGLYLWYMLRSERKIGVALAVAGAVSFFGLVYAIAY